MNEKNGDDIKEIIHNELFGGFSEARKSFISHFEQEINDFIGAFLRAYDRWVWFDSKINNDERKAYISAFLYLSLNSLLNSTSLLVSGYMIPSGNLMRTIIEAVSAAILISDNKLDYYRKIKENAFSPNKFVDAVSRNANTLGINSKSWNAFMKLRNIYNDYSHASLFNLSSTLSFSQEGALNFGAFFDVGMVSAYRKEIKSRLDFAKSLKNIIEGISQKVFKK